jgi:F0F1-type ATP synthase membrane subunit b/b'
MLIHLLILQIVTFVLLLAVLRQLFYKQLNIAIGRLNAQHAKNLEREEDLRRERELTRILKEEEVQKGRQEAERVIKAAHEQAQRAASDIEAQSKEHIMKVAVEAQLELERRERELLADQNRKAVDLGLKMVQMTFSREAGAAFQEQLVREIIGEIERLDEGAFLAPVDRVQATAAYPLSDKELEALARVFGVKMKRPVTVDLSVDPGIVAGLAVRAGALTMDGSLRSKLEKASEHLKK